MADPVVPNFINGVGRLATDRYTYEKHVNGTDDRHQAKQIDLFPTVVIGTSQTTVQDAISAISSIIGTPPPDATTTIKGIIKLAGDIAGTATNITVTKIQGKPVSTLVPSLGDVLTWDGAVWKPIANSGTFTNLTVNGNTTLGTNAGNTLLINGQTTLSNNLTVNGNTALGNDSADSTLIKGSFTVQSGPVSISAISEVFINGGQQANLTAVNTNLFAGSNISVGSNNATSISGNATNITGQIITLNAAVETRFNGLMKQMTGTLSVESGATFNAKPNSNFNISSSVNATILSPLVMGGYAKINKKYGTGSKVSNSYIFPALNDVYFAPSDMTSSVVWIIDDTTYPSLIRGFELEIINYNPTYTVYIMSPAPGSVQIVYVQPNTRAVLYRDNTTWQLKYKHTIMPF